jgi:hypothetical protein
MATSMTARSGVRWKRNGGLCPRHVRVLVEVAADHADRLGLAVTLELLLQIVLRDLQEPSRVTRHHKVRRRAFRHRKPGEGMRRGLCGACESERRRIEAYVTLLLDETDERVHASGSSPRRALCRPHLVQAIARAEDVSGTAHLRRAAQREVGFLLDKLQTTIESYRTVAHAPQEVHEVLWCSAPDWLAGSGILNEPTNE